MIQSLQQTLLKDV
jgi:hypothetical protein